MDYKKLGFKCGIEAHQQLGGKKLFCSCPTLNIRDTKADIVFERKLRAVSGETGEIDKAARHEMEKSKTYIYEGDSNDCCLVEMDEEPPQPINQEAVVTVLQVAKLLKAKIVDEIHVMRKTIVDGSNVSGFQRTALVAYDGVLETSKGDVRVPTILLEEEACQALEKTKKYTRYRLDRLGIPLIEIATAADIKDPEHAKEVAEKIGMILRSTGRVKRGIGTIRQDVNVSIKGRNRIEIKGFQELKLMPKVIENEVKRQQKLTKKEESHVRSFNKDGTTAYMRPMPGAARMYPETDIQTFKPDVKDIIVPKLLTEEFAELEKKYAISQDKVKLLKKQDLVSLFEDLVKKNKNIKPAFICETLVSYVPEILRKHKGSDPFKVNKKDLADIFSKLNDNKISKDAVMDVLTEISLGKKVDYSKYKAVSSSDIEKEIKKLVEEKPDVSIGGLMGLVMAKFKGKVDGKTAMELLRKYKK